MVWPRRSFHPLKLKRDVNTRDPGNNLELLNWSMSFLVVSNDSWLKLEAALEVARNIQRLKEVCRISRTSLATEKNMHILNQHTYLATNRVLLPRIRKDGIFLSKIFLSSCARKVCVRRSVRLSNTKIPYLLKHSPHIAKLSSYQS